MESIGAYYCAARSSLHCRNKVRFFQLQEGSKVLVLAQSEGLQRCIVFVKSEQTTARNKQEQKKNTQKTSCFPVNLHFSRLLETYISPPYNLHFSCKTALPKCFRKGKKNMKLPLQLEVPFFFPTS